MQVERGTPEDRAVVDLLAAIVMEAERSADLVAGLLGPWLGVKVQKPTGPNPGLVGEGSPDNAENAEALRDLSAALRIAEWERAGLSPHLPKDLPQLDQAGKQLKAIRFSPNTAGDLADMQLSVWFTHFAHHAYETIGADVVSLKASAVDAEMIEQLADFLWKHRGLRYGDEDDGACEDEE